jgi:hypothetical protein
LVVGLRASAARRDHNWPAWPSAKVDRATPVPDQTDTEGRQRTTTVILTRSMSWPSLAQLQKRIPGICLIRGSTPRSVGAASQSRGPVSLPGDAAVQQQAQPVVGEVAEAVADPLDLLDQ